MKIIIFIQICYLFCFVLNCYADVQEVDVNVKHRLDINISNKGVNRIMFINDRIVKIIGNEDEYNIEGDHVKGYIFIVSKLPPGQVSPITIVTEKGVVQDANLHVIDNLNPITVVVKPHIQTKKVQSPIIGLNIENQIAWSIKEIFKGETDNYTMRNVALPVGLSPNIIQAIEYSNKELIIIKLEYTGNIVLSEIYKYYPNVVASAEKDQTLFLVNKI